MNVKKIIISISFLSITLATLAQDLTPFHHKNGKHGYKDQAEKIIVEPTYDRARKFSEGLALVTLNGKFGFIDNTGSEVIPLKYKDASSFHDGLASVMGNDYKFGYINQEGKELIPLKYQIAKDFSEGLGSVSLDGKNGFIDKKGNEVIPLQYDYADSFSEGLAKVSQNQKKGFIDKNNKIVIPLKYDFAFSFSEGFAGVKQFDKFGFIDKTGKEVIALKYDVVYSFSEGLAQVERNGKCGFIDKTGREAVPVKYDRVYSGFYEGKAIVKLGDRTFSIDKNGKLIGRYPVPHTALIGYKSGVPKSIEISKGVPSDIDSIMIKPLIMDYNYNGNFDKTDEYVVKRFTLQRVGSVGAPFGGNVMKMKGSYLQKGYSYWLSNVEVYHVKKDGTLESMNPSEMGLSFKIQ